MQSTVQSYELLERIGVGGMSVVYKARHRYRNEIVALKSLSPQLATDPNFRQRFKNEAEALHKLFHPNIVRVLDFLEESEGLHLVMEYVDGITLHSIIENKKNGIPVNEALLMFQSILEGVNYAHNNGVIHRDLKPSNILVSKSNEIKITDFGIAKILGQTALTATGTRMGTLYYMSPEQIKGEKIDVQCEVYSLGVILYQMVTGHLPYSITLDTSEFEVMKKIIEDEPIQPQKHLSSIPMWLNQMLNNSIQKDKTKRFKNVDEFLKVFQNDRTEIDFNKTVLDNIKPEDLIKNDNVEKAIVDGVLESEPDLVINNNFEIAFEDEEDKNGVKDQENIEMLKDSNNQDRLGGSIYEFIENSGKIQLRKADSLSSENVKGKSKGCFIATAVYGNELASEIITLKLFRDEYLLQNKIGRAFIKFYYFISPSIADYIKQKRYLRICLRNYIIRPLVNLISQRMTK